MFVDYIANHKYISTLIGILLLSSLSLLSFINNINPTIIITITVINLLVSIIILGIHIVSINLYDWIGQLIILSQVAKIILAIIILSKIPAYIKELETDDMYNNAKTTINYLTISNVILSLVYIIVFNDIYEI